MKNQSPVLLRRKPQAGFTLYELLITMVIVGVVLSYGIANMSDFNRNGRMTATANEALISVSRILSAEFAPRERRIVPRAGTKAPRRQRDEPAA